MNEESNAAAFMRGGSEREKPRLLREGIHHLPSNVRANSQLSEFSAL
jgi:hypothetical protein